MLKNFLFALFAFTGTALPAQVDLDSMYKQAKKSRDAELARQTYRLALEMDSLEIAANSLYLSGWLYRKDHDYVNAVEFYLDASDLYRQLKKTVLLANVYEDIGAVFYYVLHYKNALQMYHKVLKLRKNHEKNGKYAQTLFNIGIVQRKLGVYDSAIYYYQQAADYYQQNDRHQPLLKVYNDMGLVMEIAEEFPIAGKYYMETLELAKQQKDKFWESRALHNMGSIAIEQDQLDGALYYYNRALEVRATLDQPRLLMSTLNQIGHAYLRFDQLDSAFRYFTAALDHTEDAEEDLLMDNYLQLSRLEEKKGNMSSALSHSRRYEEITQGLYAQQQALSEKRLFLEGKLVLEQLKAREQAHVLRVRWYQWWTGSGAFGAVALVFILYFYFKARARKRVLASFAGRGL